MMGSMGFLGGSSMILWWIIPILGIAWLAKSWLVPEGKSGADGSRTAMDFLNEAYARGEISRDEFLKKQVDIQKG